MAGGRTKSTDVRQQSVEELEWLRLTLTNIGGQYGELVDRQSWSAFVLIDDLLSSDSTPQDWLRNGAAAWIDGLHAGAELVRGVYSALSRSEGRPVRQSVVGPGKITFFIDEFTQATDPVATDVPVDMIGKVTVTNNDLSDGIPKVCLNLTLSGEAGRQTVFLSLYNLTIPPPSSATPPRSKKPNGKKPNGKKPNGKKDEPAAPAAQRVPRLPAGRYHATLSWGNGATKGTKLITVEVAKGAP